MPEAVKIKHPEALRCVRGVRPYCLCATCHISGKCPQNSYRNPCSQDPQDPNRDNTECHVVQCYHYNRTADTAKSRAAKMRRRIIVNRENGIK